MNLKEAKKILPKKEFETFEAILANQISYTSAARLKQKATLARRLRDKYRDLSKREGAGVRTRRTNETDTSLNDRKANLLQQILISIEEALEKPRPTRARSPRKKAPLQTSQSMPQKVRRSLEDARKRS